MNLEAFSAIINFVKELNEVFGSTKKATPLGLYNRIVDHIKFTDSKAICKAINGFQQFFASYEDFDKLPINVKIVYTDRIYIDISKFIGRADETTKNIIKQHLLTISAILEPDDSKLEQINNIQKTIESTSNEKEFIDGMLENTKNTFQNIDVENPTEAIMTLLSDGSLMDMVAGLQSGVQSGDMDPRKLMGVLQGTLGELMQGAQDEELVEELTEGEKGPNIEELD